jgi:Tol biopolymer transport system component
LVWVLTAALTLLVGCARATPKMAGDVTPAVTQQPACQSSTPTPGADYLPAWSPDGKRIAFVCKRGGHSDIYVMDADGGNLRRLTDDRADELGVDWRP